MNVSPIVGPNNSGKSALLRELFNSIGATPGHPPPASRVLSEATFEKEGEREDLTEWLSEHSYVAHRGTEIMHKRPHVDWMPQSTLASIWDMGPPFAGLTQFFAFMAQADGRLSMAGNTGSYDVLNDRPGSPLQTLYIERDLEKRLSRVSSDAFGVGLTVNRFGGTQIPLHFGETEVEPTTPPSEEYLDSLRQLPFVQDQGDGVRSFIGLMLALVTAHYLLIFIDEPEAFLHPPQARLLGRMLGSEAPRGTQLVVATHSVDILEGLLADPRLDVTVGRLTRVGDSNPLAILQAAEVSKLWSDPLLRYSNVLDGLFHRGVVLCEGDADCRFYAAVLDSVNDDEGQPPHDLLFTHCGGKQRMPMVIRALRAVKVPVAVISDFDVLREEEPLRSIVTELDGDWDQIKDEWAPIERAITADARNPQRHYVREQLLEVLGASNDATLSRDETAQVRALTRTTDGWESAKERGLNGVPRGETRERCTRLLETLADIGLFVVSVGELEGWVPTIGNKGPRWVGDVLERQRHLDPDLAARPFIARVSASL